MKGQRQRMPASGDDDRRRPQAVVGRQPTQNWPRRVPRTHRRPVTPMRPLPFERIPEKDSLSRTLDARPSSQHCATRQWLARNTESQWVCQPNAPARRWWRHRRRTEAVRRRSCLVRARSRARPRCRWRGAQSRRGTPFSNTRRRPRAHLPPVRRVFSRQSVCETAAARSGRRAFVMSDRCRV